MTNGEKAIWAAVYAFRYEEIRRPPKDCCKNDQKWRDWELETISRAVESAGCAVRYLREVGERVKEGHGESSEVYKMYLEMIS